MWEHITHQQLVLYGIRVHDLNISIKNIPLNDGHPIPQTILYAHDKWSKGAPSTCSKCVADDGLYYRGDFTVARKECRSGLVDATKNTIPFRSFLPPNTDSSTSDLERALGECYGEKDIIWCRQFHENQCIIIPIANITAPLLLAVLFRSAFVSIRFDHFITLSHIQDPSQCPDCSPYGVYVLRTMRCLLEIHRNICFTLPKMKAKKSLAVFKETMADMYKDTSEYLVYHCDVNRELSYEHIELPHFIVIKMYHRSEITTLAMLYMQVPPYYFGIPVSLQDVKTYSLDDYKELMSMSREHHLISKYFPVIIEKVNEKLMSERETFFIHHPDLRSNNRLLMIYPYRFETNQGSKSPKPDCSCRHLLITIYDQEYIVQSGDQG